MRIKKGDTVIVISGSDKGKTGEVVAASPMINRVLVKGVNMVTKHMRPSNAKPDGGIEKREAPLNVSKVAYLDPKEKKATKIPGGTALCVRPDQHGDFPSGSQGS